MRPITKGVFFENLFVASAGNLVRIEDGCATVTGYNLPRPLIRKDWEGGSEVRSPEVRTSELVMLVRPKLPPRVRKTILALLRQREG